MAAPDTWTVELVTLVEKRLGVHLPTRGSISSLDELVHARVLALKLASPADYVRLLDRSDGKGDEFNRLTAVVLNGQTSFFRDRSQWPIVAKFLARRAADLERPLTIWSAGCSTGEETYTLALICRHHGIDARVLGTDINPESLPRAERGCYTGWALRNIPDHYRQHYFLHRAEGFSLRDEVRELVRFRRHNLVEEGPPASLDAQTRWDVILCQNVFIYYRPALVRRVVQLMTEALDPEGLLLIGASESLHSLQLPLECVDLGGRFAYRHRRHSKPNAAEPIQPAPPLLDARAATPKPKRVTDGADYANAVTLIEREQWAEAQAHLAALAAREPKNVVVRMTLGNLSLRGHDFTGALASYLEAQSVDPLLAEVHFLQGLSYRKLADLPSAEQAMRRALFLDPSFWPASFLLASTYERLGKKSRHEQELRHTLKLLKNAPRGVGLRSHPCGLEDLATPVDEVVRLCKRALARLS